ncbi:hypothetical protein JYU34_017801 [Plutella xylostella]|uniref:Chitin-binding type-2 domain-containing protein n=1 Tax=Plutella xylostella TaxID=51655 RepID=A0ABQ7Q5Q0_PLUXY|nr:hypothetical protein JYU34_017801 [Plutella xylostella]
MISRQSLCVGASLLCLGLALVLAQDVRDSRIPATRFSCRGRGSGYYADVETGCQVYHMCDGLGRQFSYTCPNTTLFQQRMLVCDHWYMVNCSRSERDYDANLLIGQRDKPFVSEHEMQFRTPRPDILSVPPNSNYYDGLKEAESKYPVHPGNSIVGVADSLTSNNNGLDHGKQQQYRPPTSWSTGTGTRRPTSGPTRPTAQAPSGIDAQDNLAGAASQKPTPTYQTLPDFSDFNQNTGIPNSRPVSPPTQDLRPPEAPTTTEQPSSEEYDLDIRMKNSSEDPVFQFIKRFDPNSPDSLKTTMTASEILNINQQLPQGQDVSTEEERTPRRQKNRGNNFNTLQTEKRKGNPEQNRFNTINTKPTAPTPQPDTNNFSPDNVNSNQRSTGLSEPDKHLLPPKSDYAVIPSTTVGPPVYYEWKWAVPAFDLELPLAGNSTDNATAAEVPQGRSNSQGNRPFSNWSRPTTEEPDLNPSNVEYNISSYFVPDYQFPLDKPHPGYEDENAETSFQVKVGRPGRSFGENPNCPHCHPAYLNPGTCEPCIVKR